MPQNRVDTLIIGGGVTGTSVLYTLANYSNVRSIALVEQYDGVAEVNSNPRNNSQTLHQGDIETNYGLEKALHVQRAADVVIAYVEQRPERKLYNLTHKMVLAVGAVEVEAMRARYAEFKSAYPRLRLLEAGDIPWTEPRVMEGRDPNVPVVALLSHEGYAINYQALSQSFLDDALATGKDIRTFFGTSVTRIERVKESAGDKGYFRVYTNDFLVGERIMEASMVVVAAGPYSLIFAQSMGYGKELGILPVAGSFYFTDQSVLRGKVYTVQDEALPFAAVHGDPDVVVDGQTRFGPTAKVLPLLERHKYSSMKGFVRRPVMSIAGVITIIKILSDLVVLRFILKNFLYDLPVVGKWLFLKQARKIVPGIRWKELKLGKGMGGIRPQVVDTKTRTMHMGESSLIKPGIIFNTTPSPGASVALMNGVEDAKRVVANLGEGFAFQEDRFLLDHSVRKK